MQVRHLQEFMDRLANLLDEADGKNVAKAFKDIERGLEPFKSLSVRDFADFLIRADEYHRTGRVTAMPTRRSAERSPKAEDDTAIREAAQRISALKERSADAGVSEDEVDAAINQLRTTLTRPALAKLAKELGISGRLSGKAALGEIARLIRERQPASEHPRTSATTPAPEHRPAAAAPMEESVGSTNPA